MKFFKSPSLLFALVIIICFLASFFKQNFPKDENKIKNNLLTNKLETEVKRNLQKKFKIHISYVHYLDTLGKMTIENFKFFLHFAYEPCNVDVDFTIILNVNNLSQSIFERDLFKNAFNNSTRLINEFQSCQNSKNPKRNTFLIVRKNTDGGDMCAQSELVKSDFWLRNRDRYYYFFFINSSARGPFLPSYWIRKWYFMSYLKFHLKNLNPKLSLRAIVAKNRAGQKVTFSDSQVS
jgi:hypothetical protein